MIKIIHKHKYIIITIFIIALLASGVILKGNLVKANQQSEDKFPIVKASSNEESKSTKDELKYVEIKGAVYNPGVYPISDNARVQDIILVSGGLTDEADTSLINQAKKLNDEDVIIIYTKEEVQNANKNNEPITKVIANECVCPTVKNDACLTNSTDSQNKDANDQKKLVNINTATEEELTSLSGIGQSKARAIIQYRIENGNFTTIEDITNVSGIGESVYEKIKAYITT